MLVYIACARERAERARALARELERANHTIVSRWHLGSGPVPPPRSADEARDLAVCDARDMREATALLALTEVDRGHHVGGREDLVEIGMAAGLGIPIVWSSERDRDPVIPALYSDKAYEVRYDTEIVATFAILARGGTPRTMKQQSLFG